MKHFDWQKRLRSVWEAAVKGYEDGCREAGRMFSEDDQQWLATIGVKPKEVYDFAEDWHDYQEPDFATFAMIHDVRRAYFLEEQGGVMTRREIDPAKLPAKDAALRGIVWLPRIMAKAKAKLHGELDPDTMYSCPGDRRFLKEHDIHPAEFLRLVWRHEKDDEAVAAWVERRSGRGGA